MIDQIKVLSEEYTLPCGLRLNNRLVKAAMAEGLAEGDKTIPNKKFFDVYKTWAEGGWGMIMPGNVQTNPRHLGSAEDLSPDHSRINDPAYIKKWAEWADLIQSDGAAGIIQINHPGRQSPIGAGNRGMFAKAVAPSAVGLKLGPSFLAALLSKLVFGTPKALETSEIEEIIDEFVATAVLMYKAGFKGIEIHAAHGYLLAQFLSVKTNLRTDAYGGSPSKRAAIIVQIIKKMRAATSPEFCIGLKLNSADHQAGDKLEDVLTQVSDIVEAGVDFLEISGGTYEDPTMMVGKKVDPNAPAPKESTLKREAFFMDFAKSVRGRFPKVPLIVTGGFRSRAGMADAISSKGCDMVGVARPAAMHPRLPKDILLNPDMSNDAALTTLKPVPQSSLLNFLGLGFVGAGQANMYYQSLIKALGSVLSSTTAKAH